MRPLDGITVLTLEHAIAAPFCTRQLADLGARVIKVERPGSGDFARAYDQRVNGLASHFVWTNRSKESITLDVKHLEAVDVLARLVAKADVLVQNLAPERRREWACRSRRCTRPTRASSSATSRATATTRRARDRIATRRLTTC